MKRLLGTVILFLAAGVAWAGGSHEVVTIQKLTTDGSDYVLVVRPTPRTGDYRDPFMGDCPRFTVKGGYDWWHSWRLGMDVTRASHMDAIAHMRRAFAARKPINLGWMGTGFVPVGSDKCVLRSRALQLWDSEHGRGRRQSTANAGEFANVAVPPPATQARVKRNNEWQYPMLSRAVSIFSPAARARRM